MRVGELLLQRGWVDWETLALAIGDRAATGSTMRLCSYLVARGDLDFDMASRALGELHGTAAALRRHLDGRDPELAARLPEDLAHKLGALPIGRLGNGSLIVCVRDPSAALTARLTRALGEEPVLAVAPAVYLDKAIAAAYAPSELDAGDLEEASAEELRRTSASGDFDLPIDVDDQPPTDDFAIDVEEAAPQAPDKPAAKVPKKRALSVVIPVMAAPIAATRDALDTALAAFREIDEPEWLFDVAMQYVTTRWSSSLLVAVRETRAVGVRGHGSKVTPAAVKTFVVDLADVALLAQARSERRLIDVPADEPGAEHAVLAKLIAASTFPIAAPIARGDAVSHILVLGDPIGAEREDALVDLGLLLESMTEALSRM